MLPTDGREYIFEKRWKYNGCSGKMDMKSVKCGGIVGMLGPWSVQIDFASRFPPRHLEAARLRGLEASRLSDLQILLTEKRFSIKTIPFGMNFKIVIMLWHPKGPNQTLRIRIRYRYVFNIIPTSCQKRFSIKTIPFGMNFKIFIML